MFPINCFSSRSNLWIPFIYVASDVARALCIEGMYATSPSRQPPIPPALILVVAEVVKLVIALVFVGLNTRNVTLKYFHLFLIQSILYAINNTIYYYAVQLSSSGTVGFLLHIRFLITSIMHHVCVKRQTYLRPWLYLGGIFCGVILTQFHDKALAVNDVKVLLICIIISVNSACAAVLNERLLKSLDMDFWEQQVCMYVLGLAGSIAYAGSVDEVGKRIQWDALTEWNAIFTCGGISLSAISGMFTALVVVKLDTVMKLVSNAVTSVLVALIIYLATGALRTSLGQFTIGSVAVLYCTYGYATVTKRIRLAERDAGILGGGSLRAIPPISMRTAAYSPVSTDPLPVSDIRKTLS